MKRHRKIIIKVISIVIFLNLLSSCNENNVTSSQSNTFSSNLLETSGNISLPVSSITSSSNNSSLAIEEIKYNMLTDNEKLQYDNIKKTLDVRGLYKTKFDYGKPKLITETKFDFNNDGNIETLNCFITETTSESAEKSIFNLRGKTIENESSNGSGEGFSEFGLMDVDTTDGYIEFYISDGYLRGGFTTIYRLTDKGIEIAGTIDGGIMAVSGDGKIYYWGGNLFEEESDKFNTDLVLSYYDIKKKDFVKTNQIIGKTITAKEDIILFKSKEDVFDEQPMEYEEIVKESVGKIIKIINQNEKFTVLSLDDVTQIKTADGKTGWIGGFHMVWG